MKVCINGFGRIGRALFRHLVADPDFEVVHINDVNPDPHSLSYLFNYDSIYGRVQENDALTVSDDGNLIFGDLGLKITLSCEREVLQLPVSSADAVLDASGVSTNGDQIESLLRANPGLLYLATHDHPAAEEVVVVGANSDDVQLGSYRFISSSICDANAIAPVLATLNRKNEILSGHVTTVHPWLSYQNLSDGPSVSWSHPGMTHSHYPLGRSAIGNLIPKPTTAVEVSLKVAVGVRASLGSFSYRVPTPIVGSASLVLNFRDPFRTDDLVSWLQAESSKYSPKLLGFNTDPLVSSDFVGSVEAAIVDLRWTYVRHKMAHVVLWYDNEYGYAARTVEVARIFCRAKGKIQ